jgi:lysophospholipase L1-like esterase
MGNSAPRRRIPAFAAGLASLVMASGLAAAPAQAVDKVDYYAALGDSYAAGQGAGPYLDNCFRSDNAYSELADALKTVKVATNSACTGNKTQDVVETQLGQLNRKTDLVTITAGGNNIGFGDIVGYCLTAVQYPTNPAAAQACGLATANASALIGDGRGHLYGDVVAMIQSVRAAAPNAKIVVTGYPYLFDPLTSPPTDAMSLFIQNATVLANGLNVSIANAAADTGAEYVDVRTVFTGHGTLSAPVDRWINFDPLTPLSPDNLHPNADGYKAYFAALRGEGVYK